MAMTEQQCCSWNRSPLPSRISFNNFWGEHLPCPYALVHKEAVFFPWLALQAYPVIGLNVKLLSTLSFLTAPRAILLSNLHLQKLDSLTCLPCQTSHLLLSGSYSIHNPSGVFHSRNMILSSSTLLVSTWRTCFKDQYLPLFKKPFPAIGSGNIQHRYNWIHHSKTLGHRLLNYVLGLCNPWSHYCSLNH